MKRRISLAIVATFVAGAMLSLPLQARHGPSEAQLVARIQRERNPVKKAKLEVRLANVKLKQAISAYDGQKLSQGSNLLKAYLDDVKGAWHTLQASGRDPAKKPQGFMDLEISLRENMRHLTDARGRVYYANRGPIDQVRSQINNLDAQVLSALFPSLKANVPDQKHANSLTAAPGRVHP
ncbi:MAG: hypothetical protein ACRD3T_05685 [Terriglobia bacterium]